MAAATNDTLARITPVDSRYAGRVLSRLSLIRNFAVTQLLGVLYGFASCVLPMIAGHLIALSMGASFQAALGCAMFFMVAGAFASLTGLYQFGFPALLLDRLLAGRFLRSLRRREQASMLHRDRVVELVPRERWKKRLCLDTAIDLMVINVDDSGVWMLGDRYQYALPADSILGAELEGFRPPGCSFEIYMVTVVVRTEDGTIELPISYRDYRLSELWGSNRREQAMRLTEQINAIARGDQFLAPRWPVTPETEESSPAPLSTNPYAAPAMISE